jgi:hypothetical protein
LKKKTVALNAMLLCNKLSLSLSVCQFSHSLNYPFPYSGHPPLVLSSMWPCKKYFSHPSLVIYLFLQPRL